MSRQTYSIFYWDNDTKCKSVDHDPQCKIPMVSVNEHSQDKDPFAAFLSSHEHQFIDNDHLLHTAHEDTHSPELMDARKPDWGDMDPPLDNNYLKGDTVKATVSGSTRV